MFNKFYLFCLAVLLFSNEADAIQFAYQVNFTNKNGTLTFADSLTFLSHRALYRRATQGIPLDSTDLPVSKAYIDSVLTLTGGKIHEVSKWLNLMVVLVTDSNSIHALNGISFISDKKLVGYYTGTLHKDHRSVYQPVSYSTQHKPTTNGSVYYGETWNQTTMVNGNYLHDLGYKGSGKIIAVVDAGYAYCDSHRGFDSLITSGRIVDKHNFVYDTSSVFGYADHGREVLSTMAGYVPDTFVGSAPLASYALYITEAPDEQPIELINLLCGAERADSLGADIISCSLGYNTFDNPAYNFNFATDFDGKTTIAAQAANIATKKGILFVTSAGNEGGNSWNNILTPSDADSALTVGNVDITGNNAGDSGFGPNAAGQVKPDVCAMGQPGAIFDQVGFSSANGTSISTPEIAGWAACLWQAAPTATPALLRMAITKCASMYTHPGTQIGYGIPDFQCALDALHGIVDTLIPNQAIPLTVSPNPMSDVMIITYTLPASQDAHIRLTDLAGRTVMSYTTYFTKGKGRQVSHDVSALPTGMYLLKVVLPNQNQVLKVIKR